MIFHDCNLGYVFAGLDDCSVRSSFGSVQLAQSSSSSVRVINCGFFDMIAVNDDTVSILNGDGIRVGRKAAALVQATI